MTVVFGAIGFEIPSTDIPISALTIGLPLVVGTSVALAAALGRRSGRPGCLPSRRSAREPNCHRRRSRVTPRRSLP